ncbi:vomeronasal type-1 receptor 4-like [Vombatus ursinus]|uniref:vomeronasal type-1 receptor 4-like n=1 Tax=Vombatus ursinus TaxID=29139 RepID=UPI000FFD3790|nr:vomeronasal type-1 receptor 4-like [Vombatus ursinus]
MTRESRRHQHLSLSDAAFSEWMFQIIIGIFGNGLLLYLYSSNLITCPRIRTISLVLINVAFSNIMMILFREVPWAIQICIQEIFLADAEYKIIIYLQRVCRGFSLCTTCFLSVCQAKIICSSSPKWVELKVRAPKCIVLSCVFMFGLILLIDMIVTLYVTGTRNNTNNELNRNLRYFSTHRYAMTTSKLIIWISFYNAVFVDIMAITSGYMVLVLYTHHRQVQHTHKTSYSPNASAETRATKIILLLMSIFVCFYSVSSLFIILLDNSKDTNQWVIYVNVFFNLCYPVVSPFVLICSDSQIPSPCNVYKRMKMAYLLS